ncbi:MAG TPA: flippase [candidate division WOR-3 bacterium]|mgnify:CR=1 FL=1|uniref:Flippase n=1 Tax=candidate division WOR-3 bacterium TaxID=2052148 RepID=A0A7V0T514_UNCW3|nr:flippase [candidate division WOR-3 bacterium]
MLGRPARNAGFLFVGELATRALGFAVTAVLTRRLGLDAFGQIAFGLSITAYGIMMTKAGLLTIGIRSIAREPQEAGMLAGRVLTLRLLLAGLAFAGIVVFALLLPRPAEVRWLLVLFAFGVFAQAIALEWVFTGEERMHHIAGAHILTNGVYFLLVFVFVGGPAQLLFVPAAFVVATLAGAAYLLANHSRRHGLPRLAWEPTVWRGLAVQALPVGLASILTQLHVNAPIVALALFRGDAEAGLYSAAHRFVFFVLLLDRIVQTVFLPIAARHYRTRRKELPATVGSILRAALALAAPVCVLVVVFGPQVAALLFGAGFIASGEVMRVLIWFFPLSLVSTVGGYTLLAGDRERRYALNTVVGVTAALVFVIFGSLRFGPLGAAAGMVAGEAVLAALMVAGMLGLVRPRLGRRALAVPAAIVPMVGIIIAFANWHWLVVAATAVAAYALVVFLARGVRLGDLGLGGSR